MDKGKLIWGIICLALAALLVILNAVLPSGSMMFQVGDTNMPWVPPAILGIVGIVLLAMATRGGAAEPAPQMGAEAAGDELLRGDQTSPPDSAKVALNKRLETIAWGLFLVMLGGFMLVPHTVVAKGVWSIGVGLIMLGLNGARYLNGIKMSGFTTLLGIVSLIGGALQIFALPDLEGGVLLIVLGAYLLLKPWFDRRGVFGKAEES